MEWKRKDIIMSISCLLLNLKRDASTEELEIAQLVFVTCGLSGLAKPDQGPQLNRGLSMALDHFAIFQLELQPQETGAVSLRSLPSLKQK